MTTKEIFLVLNQSLDRLYKDLPKITERAPDAVDRRRDITRLYREFNRRIARLTCR